MKTTITSEMMEAAHKRTIYHETEIMQSEKCTCFYCGYHFDPRKEALQWIEERAGKERTLHCPKCYIDCVIGSASGFPITDDTFVSACSEAWFRGISPISDRSRDAVTAPILIVVD